ncbi:MAG: MerR family transcriptional regulator [Lachnospiraceae bacterium]|nr:MerR family transcriptional regulator [Lachnospiraceae bacterium]
MADHSDQKLLKIGELAAMAGISVKAMHVYEEKNIIRPVEVDPATGYRYYRADQLSELESLLALQDMGFSLNEISSILSGNCSKEELSGMFESKKEALNELIMKTEAKIQGLDSMRESLESGTEKMREMSEEERARFLARLVVLNEENIRQTLSEVIWL